ncbi:MAG: BMP family protein [Lautropia sp.]
MTRSHAPLCHPPPAETDPVRVPIAHASRRSLLLTTGRLGAGLAAGVIAAPVRHVRAAGGPITVGLLIAGRIDDRGFMQAGFGGFERAREMLGVKTRLIDGVKPQKPLLAAALTTLAESGADLVIAHGGQNNEAAREVSARFPGTRFAVTQGGVVGPNLASYEVLQEQSAYLAGVLAASTTRSGVVGHMSGIRVKPGLKGRAAYVAGVRATNPDVKVLTNFSGNQDDNALSRRVALAQIAGGADVIFTMLNAGRTGAIDACREKGAKQIGNVVDWVAAVPDVFVGSAIADVSIGVFNAIRDVSSGRFEGGVIRRIGLEAPEAVKLALAADVPAAVRERIAKVAADIREGRVAVPDAYDGPEFATPA